MRCCIKFLKIMNKCLIFVSLGIDKKNKINK